ncbi:protein kinase [Candidatus Sumerlaeota bacterium]|nr:protein kinase [Candidatus Sumerlaeota bacterium]
MIKWLYKKYADGLVAKGQKRKALVWYRKAGDLKRMADILFDLGDYEEAMKQYASLSFFERAAQVALKAGRNDLALEYFRKTSNLKEAARQLLEAGDIKSYAVLMSEQDMKQEAAETLEKMGQLTSAARLYAEMENFEKAIALFRQCQSWDQMISAYKARGDLEKAAEECLEHEEFQVAAALYTLNEQFSHAAEVYMRLGRKDKALELFENAGDFESIAQIHIGSGRLDMAALAYEKIPGMDHMAGEIYEKLLILDEMDVISFKNNIQCGVASSDGSGFVLCKVNRSVTYTTSDLNPKWRIIAGGDGIPRAVDMTKEGKHIIVGTEGTVLGKDNFLTLITNKKEILWEKSLPEPVKAVKFLANDTDFVAAIGDEVYCFSIKGEEKWAREVDFKPWSIDVSSGGDRLLVGTLGGTVYLLNSLGDEKGRYSFGERIHRIQFTPDGENFIAAWGDKSIIYCNMNFEKIWEYSSDDQVRMMKVYPGRDAIISLTTREISLINLEGDRIYAAPFEQKIMTFFTDDFSKTLYVALEDKTLHKYSIRDCKIKAAECFTRAGNKSRAAIIYRSVERYSEAYNLFKEIGDFENAASTLHLTGDLLTSARHYEVIGKYETAADIYKEIGELNLAAKCYGKAGKYQDAATLYEELGDYILAADFYERVGQYKKAGILFSNAQQDERAVLNYESHIKEFPQDKETMFELGKNYQKMERYDDAIRMFQKITETPEYKKDSLKRLGQCFLSNKIYDVALDRFFECLGKDAKPSQDNIDVLYDIGKTYLEKGDYENAKATFGKVMAIDYYYKDIQERLRTSERLATRQIQEAEVAATRMVDTAQAPASVVETQPHIRYKIIKKLGEGGMGVVYLANDTKLNRQVAWKVLPPAMAKDEDMKKRMLNEARAAAKLSHHNIISIYDIIMTENECSIIMEYIDGITLRTLIYRQPQLPLDKVMRYGTQISQALQAAHHSGIIHRDLKPENIMITSENDEVKVVDFGLARLGDDMHLTREGCILGTIPYMAPEQIMARDIVPQTDLYALGIILYEMLVGKTPFTGENVLAQHLNNAPPNLLELRIDTPAFLNDLVMDCLEKDPKSRPIGSSQIIERLKGDK